MCTLHNTPRDYWLPMCATESRTLANKGKHPIRMTIVLERQILEEIFHFNHLGCDISDGTEVDWDNKLAKCRSMCGTIHRRLKNKLGRITRKMFIKTVAILVFLHSGETWSIGKKRRTENSNCRITFLVCTQGCSL